MQKECFELFIELMEEEEEEAGIYSSSKDDLL